MNKVVLLAPTPPPVGGIAMWTTRMMKASLKDNWGVTVVDEKIIGKRQFFGDNVKRNYFIEVLRCFKIWAELWKKLNDKEIKVVHSCIAANPQPVLREYICACIAKIRKRKYIIHFRCTVPNRVKSKFNRFVVKKICDKSDCVMVLNSQSAEFIRELSSTKVELIPNFVETGEITADHIINKEVKKVLYTGGVIESKGCLDLITVAQNFPSIEFRMAGSPSTEIKDAAKNVDNVKLLGVLSHDEVQKELREADIFVFLSYFRGEGFSNSLAEAMAAGLPCLVTDWAANKDMIEDKGGIAVPIKNPEAAVNALKQMLPIEIRRKQSEFNIAKIKNAYSDEVVLCQYVDCYENLLQ